MRKFLVLILLLMFSTDVLGVTIHGSVYDLTLKKVNNVVVELNTNPRQRFVAINGSYEFEVPFGDYKITSYYNDENLRLYVSENISVVNDGNYVLDLFLYPSLYEEEELYNDIEFDVVEPYNESNNITLPLVLGIISLIIVFAFFLLKKPKKKKEKKSDLDNILLLLEKNHGRMTQRDIRKEFPMSEAKISLMIAELEHMGKVKKIKQGRGNIIIKT